MEKHSIVYAVAYTDPNGRAINVIQLIEFVFYTAALFLHCYYSDKLTFIYITGEKSINGALLWYISSMERKLIVKVLWRRIVICKTLLMFDIPSSEITH